MCRRLEYQGVPTYLILSSYLGFPCRSAGTVGAVVTCPLEVVKTRLQSSTAFLPTATTTRIVEPAGGPANGGASELLRPEQRRKLSTTILRNRSQPQVIGGVRRVVPNSYYCYYFHILSILHSTDLNHRRMLEYLMFIALAVIDGLASIIDIVFTDYGYITLRHLLDYPKIHEYHAVSPVSREKVFRQI